MLNNIDNVQEEIDDYNNQISQINKNREDSYYLKDIQLPSTGIGLLRIAIRVAPTDSGRKPTVQRLDLSSNEMSSYTFNKMPALTYLNLSNLNL